MIQHIIITAQQPVDSEYCYCNILLAQDTIWYHSDTFLMKPESIDRLREMIDKFIEKERHSIYK